VNSALENSERGEYCADPRQIRRATHLTAVKNHDGLKRSAFQTLFYFPLVIFPWKTKAPKHKNMRDKNRAGDFRRCAILAPQNLQIATH
jgi:hypothetical protein